MNTREGMGVLGSRTSRSGLAANQYHFVTHWRVRAPREEVFEVLTDSEGLARWWPSVYRDVQPIAASTGPGGVGKRLLLDTQGWLPYRLRWELCVVEHQPPSRLALEATGGFLGSGVWILTQDGGLQLLRSPKSTAAGKDLSPLATLSCNDFFPNRGEPAKRHLFLHPRKQLLRIGF